jgi:aerobic-type carbon monoxide dehydrogenase small subunit (CoxS/CutS family)
MAILSACASAETITNTVTTTSTLTSTVAGSTLTVTSPATTISVTVRTYLCPLDDQEFGTLDALKAHFAASHPRATLEGLTQFVINGKSYWRSVESNWTLAYVLREKFGLTGTKRGCDRGECGACTIIMAGRPVLSCLVLAVEADGRAITTIEGLARPEGLDPLQQAFITHDGLQCGFCTPGQIMTAKALLAFKGNPTLDEIREFMAGTLCRCASHPNIVRAIQAAAQGR